jgi:hypothetical protein
MKPIGHLTTNANKPTPSVTTPPKMPYFEQVSLRMSLNTTLEQSTPNVATPIVAKTTQDGIFDTDERRDPI